MSDVNNTQHCGRVVLCNATGPSVGLVTPLSAVRAVAAVSSSLLPQILAGKQLFLSTVLIRLHKTGSIVPLNYTPGLLSKVFHLLQGHQWGEGEKSEGSDQMGCRDPGALRPPSERALLSVCPQQPRLGVSSSE